MFNLPETYAVKHKDEHIRMESRSGGVFTALSDYILEQDGVIYGCIINEDMQVMHIRASDRSTRDRMRGSKYVQSDLKNVYKEVLKDITEDRMVLFSGTSCQIDGLRAFIGMESDKLYCVDILCHGVPSPLIFRDYINYLTRKHGKCLSVDFRNKKDFGWKDHVETYILAKKKIDSREYSSLFCGHTILRPSCYECPYRTVQRKSDITIADYWGIEKNVPEYDDNRGCSLVLVNSVKGAYLFNEIKNEIIFEKTKLSTSMQLPLEGKIERPFNRNQVWNDYKSMPFQKFIAYYGEYTLMKRIKTKILKLKYRVLWKR